MTRWDHESIQRTEHAVAVVGAGIAGIAVVGSLLDAGMEAGNILWVDPAFAVGDLGEYWQNVSGNTKVKTLQGFLEASPAFGIEEGELAELTHIGPNQVCDLGLFVHPLERVTERLREQVHAVAGYVTKLCVEDYRPITIATRRTDEEGDVVYGAERAVLATGSVPRTLEGVPTIPALELRDVLDPTRIAEHIDYGDIIAVYGSSHSAILAIKNIAEVCADMGVTIVNFYRSPLRYAFEKGGKIHYDNTGLKGTVAEWAQRNLGVPESEQKLGIVRVLASEENIANLAPTCTKAVYAVGLQRRAGIGGIALDNYNTATGEIVEGRVWGIGSGYPERAMDPSGQLEDRVGAAKFMEHVRKRIVPALVRSLGK